MPPNVATVTDVNTAIANQSTQTGLQNVLLSSANNNHETARLIEGQTMTLMNQNNTNLINAIQGFNQVGQQIMNQTNVLGSKLDQLGYQMENCCCSIKTLIKDNQIADLTNQLNNANNVAVNSAQSQYLLSQMGKWVANAHYRSYRKCRLENCFISFITCGFAVSINFRCWPS